MGGRSTLCSPAGISSTGVIEILLLSHSTADDARPRGRSIMVVIEGVTLAVSISGADRASREKIATTTRVFMETFERGGH